MTANAQIAPRWLDAFSRLDDETLGFYAGQQLNPTVAYREGRAVLDCNLAPAVVGYFLAFRLEGTCRNGGLFSALRHSPHLIEGSEGKRKGKGKKLRLLERRRIVKLLRNHAYFLSSDRTATMRLNREEAPFRNASGGVQNVFMLLHHPNSELVDAKEQQVEWMPRMDGFNSKLVEAYLAGWGLALSECWPGYNTHLMPADLCAPDVLELGLLCPKEVARTMRERNRLGWLTELVVDG